MHEYYRELLKDFPDVLGTEMSSQITGYCTTSINNWCSKGRLKSFKKANRNHIPKVYLIDFFCSPYFRTITRKSEWHIHKGESIVLPSFALFRKADYFYIRRKKC